MYKLFQDIISAGSSFVGRLRDNAVYKVVCENNLTPADVEAGVIRDAVVWLGSEGKSEDLKQPVRIVEVKCEPHRKRSHTGRGSPEQSETILLVTDRLDLSAEVIGLIFRHRWTVEIFFRFFKHVLGCRHLLSTKEEGVKLQTYCWPTSPIFKNRHNAYWPVPLRTAAGVDAAQKYVPLTLFFTQSAEKTVPKRKIISSANAVPNRIVAVPNFRPFIHAVWTTTIFGEQFVMWSAILFARGLSGMPGSIPGRVLLHMPVRWTNLICWSEADGMNCWLVMTGRA